MEFEIKNKPNTTTILVEEKFKNIISRRKGLDSLILKYDNKGKLSKLKYIVKSGISTEYFYQIDKEGQITYKGTKNGRTQKMYEEFTFQYSKNTIVSNNYRLYDTVTNIYIKDSKGLVIQEWEKYKNKMILKRKFLYDDNHRFTKEIILAKEKLKFDHQNKRLSSRTFEFFEEPKNKTSLVYYNNIDTTIIETYNNGLLMKRVKNWKKEGKKYKYESKYSNIYKSTTSNGKTESGNLYGIARETKKEITKDSIFTALNSYSITDNFELYKSIIISEDKSGNGYFKSSTDISLDCNDTSIEKVRIREFKKYDNKNVLIEKTIKHEEDIVYSYKRFDNVNYDL